MNDEIKSVFSLFFDGAPIAAREIDTSRGDADFRATFIVERPAGGKVVIKLADNDFRALRLRCDREDIRLSHLGSFGMARTVAEYAPHFNTIIRWSQFKGIIRSLC